MSQLLERHAVKKSGITQACQAVLTISSLLYASPMSTWTRAFLLAPSNMSTSPPRARVRASARMPSTGTGLELLKFDTETLRKRLSEYIIIISL